MIQFIERAKKNAEKYEGTVHGDYWLKRYERLRALEEKKTTV